MSKTKPIAKGISCDPRIQFGAPCVIGRRVCAEMLYGLSLRDDNTFASIAKDYGLQEEDVEYAVEWWEAYGVNAVGMVSISEIMKCMLKKQRRRK